MNIWWGALIIASIGTFFWGLDRAIRKSEAGAAQAAANLAIQQILKAQWEAKNDDSLFQRQVAILDLLFAVEDLHEQAKAKKLFSVSQQLEAVIAVLNREYQIGSDSHRA